ncbi:M23 family metallopeptidase [Actinopolymorpha alba]|uniref:M23 family metallopeptidase n=1 Tax=Actinopolymorpha alba TaxID=533267 RepID=UPI00192BAA04|nr:M23 family metallopeptidase [Actinopolymorpha alba]
MSGSARHSAVRSGVVDARAGTECEGEFVAWDPDRPDSSGSSADRYQPANPGGRPDAHRVDQHGVDQHGVDQHGVDQRGVDRQGVGRQGVGRRVALVAVAGALVIALGAMGWVAWGWLGSGLPRLGPLEGFGVDEPGPRPDFKLPFACGQRWRISTYRGHNPDEMKLDMFRSGGTTGGAVVRASAPGRVRQLVSPGGVKIDHGGRWYTLYLHMDDITVRPGQEIAQGQEIGRVGAVGTRVAHLHYEQLFDANGDGNARTPEMVHPVLEGVPYQLQPGGPFPVVRSTNAC